MKRAGGDRLERVQIAVERDVHTQVKAIFAEAGTKYNFSAIVRELERALLLNAVSIRSIGEITKEEQIAIRIKLDGMIKNFFKLLENYGSDIFNNDLSES